MYDKNRYNKFKHVAAAALYAAILLTEAGEFFVSNHKIYVDHDTQIQHEREIPEHTPEKYERISLKVLKVCRQKTTYVTNDNHSVNAVCFVVSILRGGSAGNLSEINHRFIG